MSFWVDPPALLIFGALAMIFHARYETPKAVLYAFCGGTIAAFVFGGIGLYLDWFRWTIPGLVDLKGSYVMFDQGLTGITKATFPTWIVPIFLFYYPFWFALGYEVAKKRYLKMRVVPYLLLGIIILAVPSILESYMLTH